jgi:EAL domain-containing protein (putative c-di-GMP-specific phosphodiesterase class I)
LENQLRSAVRNREFELHYQPQLSLATGEVVGVEALLRWRTEFGLIPPIKFIPTLEQSGMIEELTPWAFLTACRQLRAWSDMGFPAFRVAVNLSARQLLQTDLLNVIDDVLRETGVDPKNLEIEVTESVLLDPEAINGTAHELLAMGIRLTIDDFGTGYCSLSYLKQLSADALKIDRSFIQDIPADQDDVAISEAIINLSRSLGLYVIAEGVETPEQWEFLQSHGCHMMQGFLVSKPLSADDFAKWLNTSCRPMAGSFY